MGSWRGRRRRPPKGVLKSQKQTLLRAARRFRHLIGAVDARVPFTALQFTASTDAPALVAKGKAYRVYAVRWPVFEDVDAEGLLLEPEGKPRARIVAIPMQTGRRKCWPDCLRELTLPHSSPAVWRRTAARFLIPVLIDRSDTWSGIPGVRMTNQPHREWIYRMAYESNGISSATKSRRCLRRLTGSNTRAPHTVLRLGWQGMAKAGCWLSTPQPSTPGFARCW